MSAIRSLSGVKRTYAGRPEIDANGPPQPNLILAPRITFPHFSVWSLMNCPNSTGVVFIGIAPSSLAASGALLAKSVPIAHSAEAPSRISLK